MFNVSLQTADCSSDMDVAEDLVRCPVTQLNKRELDIVRSSWQTIRNQSSVDEHKSLGVILLFWLLDNVPNMRKRLAVKIPRHVPYGALQANEMFIAHSESLIMALDSFVHLSNDPKKLEEKMRSTAKIHTQQNPTVGLEYFSNIERNFDKFISTCLSCPPDDERVQIWVKFITAFCHIVYQEEELRKKKGCCSLL